MEQIPLEEPEDFLLRMLRGQESAVASVGAALPALRCAVEEAAQRLKGTQGRIIYIGAGTSGRLGRQDGIELEPTYGWLRAAFAIAGEDKALKRSVEGAEDNREAAQARIAELAVGPNDVCIAVSASGKTPYTVAACEAAHAAGALTIGIASHKDAPLFEYSDHKLFLDSGPEPVNGSTRMNAGTAQKVALNMISTAIMAALGRVYDGHMVFVQPTCAKLVARAKGIIRSISGCDEETAARVFNEAAALGDKERHVPVAVLVAAGNIDIAAAVTLLKEKDDHFGQAMESLRL